MSLSSTPFLLLAVLGWTAWTVESMYRAGETGSGPRRALWVLLAAWLLLGVLATVLGLSGVSTSPQFLAAWPLYWYPFLPPVVAVTGMLLLPRLARGLYDLVDHRGSSFLVQVHLLRLLAVGGIAKAVQGGFTLPFAIVVGGADLLFALSAVVVWRLAARGPLSRGLLLWWNLAGALVILAPILLLGHWLMQDPQFATLFAFPMLLAPGVIVPLLVSYNLLVVWRLLTRRRVTERDQVTEQKNVGS